MGSIVIATIKSWNIRLAKALQQEYPEHKIWIVSEPGELTEEWLETVKPDFIFFPHWSWIIPREIYTQYVCIVFHMTDLPFGRGGSPLQNLLVRGIYLTRISAIRVQEGLDTGDVYMKEPLDISTGNADDILRRASEVIFEKMIPRFLWETIIPKPQQGKPTVFLRRKPEESRIPEHLSAQQLYDYIRMLDGEGYPAAFIEGGFGKIYFRNPVFRDGRLTADAFFEVTV